jgi:exopolyphosphatase / guanosine-5'-triphosphate,3'-diphosphate pyrophosphatase
MLELFQTFEERVVSKRPVAIVDIGSNSVRLVVYDGLGRAPTPIFNEKALCALGQGVVSTGQLSQAGIDKALAALRRFKTLIGIMDVEDVHVIATAAARDASNGPMFLAAAGKSIGTPVTLLAGRREAELSALGVVSGFHAPDGIVADLGGGSLELIDVKGNRLGKGITLPLGGLSLMDASDQSLKSAVRIARETLAKVKLLDQLRGRTLYAVGGTWRAIAKLHMRQRNYMLSIMHGYVIPTREAQDFAALVERVNADALVDVDLIAPARRPLLAYGAIVLDEIIRRAQPKEIIISASGVREGLLFEKLDAAEQKQDPLLVAAREFNQLAARAPHHAEELCDWTDQFMKSAHLDETADERRLRHAACLLADVNWRAHPDYRAEQSLNIVANAAFTGIDHAGRAFLALATAYRYLGLEDDGNPGIRALVPSRLLERARLLASIMRVGYVISAAMPDTLPRAPLVCIKTKLVLTLPADLADLVSDRLNSRLKQLGRLIAREPAVVIGG